MAERRWSTEMDRRIVEMRRDPVKYVEAARRDAGRTTTVSSDRRESADSRTSTVKR